MRLLVSVRDAAEARAAVMGGADIVDAKEPRAGALGPVAPELLPLIRAAVPPDIPLSAALGDAASCADLDRRMEGIRIPLTFVKLGFAGLGEIGRIREILTRAVHRVRSLPGSPALVLVAYADWEVAGGPAPADAVHLLRVSGAAGLLVDTADKRGLALPGLFGAEALSRLGEGLRTAGLLYAIAGSLAAADFALARSAGADIVGVRGAACIGGREGVVDAGAVRGLRRALAESAGAAVPA